MQIKAKHENNQRNHIHLNRVFGFRPQAFGCFVAFPEIRQFANNKTHTQKERQFYFEF